jgi:hypothetical protein
LAAVGGLLSVGGAVILATTPEYVYDDYGFATNEDEVTTHVTGGIICLTVGIEMLIGGIVLNSIGSKKCKQYKAKLENLSMKILCTPKQQGFMLTYRF